MPRHATRNGDPAHHDAPPRLRQSDIAEPMVWAEELPSGWKFLRELAAVGLVFLCLAGLWLVTP